MTAISLSYDDDQIRRLDAALDDRSLRLAQSSVLNRMGAKVRTTTNRGIRQRLALKSRDVNSALRIQRASPQRLEWRLQASGSRISLRKFGARQTRRGVTVRIRPRSGRLTLARSFIGPNQQVFRRKGRPRLPIVKLTGPSIPQAMTNQLVRRAQDELVRKEYPSQMVRELKFRIERARRR